MSTRSEPRSGASAASSDAVRAVRSVAVRSDPVTPSPSMALISPALGNRATSVVMCSGRDPAIPLVRQGLRPSVGNRATASLLLGRDPTGPMTPVYRHASWEHVMLGNTAPSRLGDAVVSGDAQVRAHLLEELGEQMVFFQADPTADPTGRFPGVRWLQLRKSGLWLSYGELNALTDYLPPRADELEESVVLPVLQRMRAGVFQRVCKYMPEEQDSIYGDDANPGDFKGQADSGAYEVTPAGEEKAMDMATEDLGTDRYFGLVARNACHFAPFSWHRWAHFHESAREHAVDYHRRNSDKRPVKDIDVGADEQLRQAWLQNGYGDHFLQDSFAAGHLVNKTLVMQWFVDYVNDMASKWWDLLPLARLAVGDTRPWYGMPSDEVMENMGTREQPGMAGRGLYRPPTSGGATAHEDWDSGWSTTDPQTAQERRTRDQRVAGSGVQAGGARTREQNYQAYLDFLNSTFLQLAAGEVHDYLNERGLVVGNQHGDTLHVGGDDTLLSKSGPLGAEVAGEAAQKSQQAIDDLTRTGKTEITVESIMELVPRYVWADVGGTQTKLPLEQWHDDVLHDLCKKHIFPKVVTSFTSKAVRALSPQLTESGVGREGETPTPAPPVPKTSEMGDFPLPGPGDDVPV